MKKLFFNTLKIIVLTTIIIMISSVYYDRRIKKNDIYYDQLRDFKKKKNIEVLFLGDSRPTMGIRNQQLPQGWYNYAFLGDSLQHTFVKLKIVHSRHPELKAVVLPLCYHIFSTDITAIERGKNWREYLENIDYTYLETRFVKPLPKTFLKDIIDTYFAALDSQKRETLMKVILKDLFVEKERRRYAFNHYGDVFFPHTGYWDRKKENERILALKEYVAKQKLSEIDDVFLESLKKIINYCEENSILLVGIRYPVPKNHMSVLQEENIDEIDAIINKEFPYKMLNYSYLFKDNPNYFQDTDHLNPIGSEKLTNVVINDLIDLFQSNDENTDDAIKLLGKNAKIELEKRIALNKEKSLHTKDDAVNRLPRIEKSANGEVYLVRNGASKKLIDPAIAASAADQLIVWQSNEHADKEINGMFVNQDFSVQSSIFRINSSAVDDQYNPAAASDGENYLVVWESKDTQGEKSDIYGQFISNKKEYLTEIIGNDVDNITNNFPPGELFFWGGYEASFSGESKGVWLKIKKSSGAAVSIAVYNDLGTNYPDEKLNETQFVTVPPSLDGWQFFPFLKPLKTVAGQKYWFAWAHNNADHVHLYYYTNQSAPAYRGNTWSAQQLYPQNALPMMAAHESRGAVYLENNAVVYHEQKIGSELHIASGLSAVQNNLSVTYNKNMYQVFWEDQDNVVTQPLDNEGTFDPRVSSQLLSIR